MSLLVLPTKTDGSVGRVKNTLPEDVGVEYDLDFYETAAEAERQKDALIAIAARMGLGDGSTPGSFEKMKVDLETGAGMRLLIRDDAGEYSSIRIAESPTAPYPTSDYTAGFRVGSWWVERTPGDGGPGPVTLWECIGDTDGAAVWRVRAQPSDALPLAADTASAGTSATFARADHVHPYPVSVVEEIAITFDKTLVAGDAVALVAGRVERSDARAGTVVPGYIGQCVTGGTGDSGGTIKARVVVAGVAPASGLTAGLPVYLSTTTIGAVTTTAPSGLGALSQIVGRALSATTFAMQVDSAVSVDWCSPLDIPTNGIFYGRASSANLLASGRITTNGIADLFGTGRFATIDASGSAPLHVSGGAPGGYDAWQFLTSRSDRLRIAHDAGTAGTLAWSGVTVSFMTGHSQRSLIAKTNGSAQAPFDFAVLGDLSLTLPGETVTPVQRGWRVDGFSRPATGSGLQGRLFSRGAAMPPFAVGALSAGTDDLMIGNRTDLVTGWEGFMAAFAIWTRALTDAEQIGLAKWARREWAL